MLLFYLHGLEVIFPVNKIFMTNGQNRATFRCPIQIRTELGCNTEHFQGFSKWCVTHCHMPHCYSGLWWLNDCWMNLYVHICGFLCITDFHLLMFKYVHTVAYSSCINLTLWHSFACLIYSYWRQKWKGKLGFMLDFHYDSLIINSCNYLWKGGLPYMIVLQCCYLM